MTLSQFEVFLEVAQTLSFSKAAERLHLAQPAVSRYIRQLEQELQVLLVDRSLRREIRLTEMGQEFYEMLLRCRKDFHQVMSRIHQESENHPLIINVLDTVTLPTSLLKQFTYYDEILYPEQTFQIRFTSYAFLQQKLEKGEFLLISADELKVCRNFFYVTLPLAPEPYQLIYSAKDEILRSHSSPSASDFQNSTLILAESCPVPMIQNAMKIYRRDVGPLSNDNLLFLPETRTVFLFLQSGRGVTITDNWSQGSSLPGLCSLSLPTKVSHVLAWDPVHCNPINLSRLKKLLLEKK